MTMINNNALQFKRRKGFRFLNTFQGLCLHIHTDTEKEKDLFLLIILFLSTGYWLSHTINYAQDCLNVAYSTILWSLLYLYFTELFSKTMVIYKVDKKSWRISKSLKKCL